jgi:hypothetical protein
MTEDAHQFVKRLADKHWDLIEKEQAGLRIHYQSVLPRVKLLVAPTNRQSFGTIS